KQFWFVDIQEYQRQLMILLTLQYQTKKYFRYDESNLLGKCYTIDSLSKLDNLKIAHEQLSSNTPCGI
ncbi:hypothetical protein, partial [Yersinia enterocolitica]|uniref:hypothetical protein n=1 Tax=Yersinia enterocolitica TaxID=630 RepID=UPI001D101D37